MRGRGNLWKVRGTKQAFEIKNKKSSKSKLCVRVDACRRV